MAEKKDTKDQSAELQKETTVRQQESGGRPSGDDDVVLVKAGQKASLPTADGGEGERFVTIEKDVILEVEIENAKRPSHILLFRKGQVVTQSDIDRATGATEA